MLGKCGDEVTSHVILAICVEWSYDCAPADAVTNHHPEPGDLEGCSWHPLLARRKANRGWAKKGTVVQRRDVCLDTRLWSHEGGDIDLESVDEKSQLEHVGEGKNKERSRDNKTKDLLP